MTKNRPKKRTNDPHELDETRRASTPSIWHRLSVYYRRDKKPPTPKKAKRPRGSRALGPAIAVGVSVFATFALLIVIFIHVSSANAQETAATDETRTEDESPNLDDPLYPAVERDPTRKPLTPRDHFSPYPADPGAWTYDDLADEEKIAIDDARQWAELNHSRDVHAAFSGLSRKRSAEARGKAAERAIGAEGLARIGVSP